jgi:hypothetical protein
MKMKAPPGTEEVSADGISYPLDADGCVDVPLSVAVQLEWHRFVEWVDPKAKPAKPE